MKNTSEILKNQFSSQNNPLCEGYLSGAKVIWLEQPKTLEEIGCEYCPGLKMYSSILNDRTINSSRRVAFCYQPECPRPRTSFEYNQTSTALEWTKLGFPETHKGKYITNYNFQNPEGLELCKQFIFSDTWNLWIFGGETGAGKTHLAQGLAIQNYYSKGHQPTFILHPQLYYEAKEASKQCTESKFMDKWVAIDFMVLDDLGTANASAYERTVIYDLLSRRVAACKKTIITTNLSKEQVFNESTGYGERFKRRVSEYGRWTNFLKPSEMA